MRPHRAETASAGLLGALRGRSGRAMTGWDGFAEAERPCAGAAKRGISVRDRDDPGPPGKCPFKSPYLRNYVVARINPVRFHRAKQGDTKPPMTLVAAVASDDG